MATTLLDMYIVTDLVTYFASKARAIPPDTIGAAALVPLNSLVHILPVLEVLCKVK